MGKRNKSNGNSNGRPAPPPPPQPPMVQQRRRKTRDDDCCSVNFIKYSLHIFNVVFFISGLALVGVAAWTIFFKHIYISLLTSLNFAFAAYGLFVAGCLAIFGGILGCCGIWREHRAMILSYTFMLLIVFLLEVLIGGLSYVYETQIESELNLTLNSTFMENYGVDLQQTKDIDEMQQRYICCSAFRFEDWRHSIWYRLNETNPLRPVEGRLVPDSCCISETVKCGQRDHPNNIPYTGCIYKMTEELQKHLIILGAVGLGVCVIQIFGMVCSCCLYVKLKNFD